MAAVTVDTLNVDDTIKAQVRQLISKAGTDAVDKAKVEFRAGVAGTRRPEIFDPSKSTITSYFEGFEPFKKVVGLTGSNAIQSFLTYLDPQSLSKVQRLPSLDEDDWASFKEEVTQALSSPREAVQARFELKKASQRADETVAQFGERLRNLGRLGYKPNDVPAMESAMKDALAGGVIRDEISIFLIGSSEDTFAKCLEGAIMLDSAFKARSTLKNNDMVDVSVLKNERNISSVSADRGFPATRPTLAHLDQPPMFISGVHESSRAPTYGENITRPSDVQAVICYSCQRPGHYASQCPLQAPLANTAYRSNRTIFCHYCGAIGHLIRECRNKARNESRLRSQGVLCGHSGPTGYQSQESNFSRFSDMIESNMGSQHLSQDARVQSDRSANHGQSFQSFSNFQEGQSFLDPRGRPASDSSYARQFQQGNMHSAPANISYLDSGAPGNDRTSTLSASIPHSASTVHSTVPKN